jgi:hypothetical protein
MLASNPEWFKKKSLAPVFTKEQTKITCMDTPLVGKIYEKTTKIIEKRWDDKCIISKIDSCNSRVNHT